MYNNFKTVITILQTNENKFKFEVMHVRSRYIIIDASFLYVLNKLSMLKTDIELKHFKQIDKKRTFEIPSIQTEVQNEQPNNDIVSWERKLAEIKLRQLRERRLTSNVIVKPKLILPAKEAEVEKEEAK